MATCPLARILSHSDAECEKERCQWWVNTSAPPGSDCIIKFTLLALYGYISFKQSQ